MGSPLATYLNDHLAGSAVMLEIAQRLARRHAGTELGTFLNELVGEVREDRRALEDVMAQAGVGREQPKQALAWVTEKIARLKLDDRLLRRSTPTTLLDLETLELGITGKELLWRVLAALPAAPTAGHSLDELIARAERQRAGVETHRATLGAAELRS
jgi:hypothetical protein